MNPRIIIYVIVIIVILFVLANMYRTYRMSKHPDLKRRYQKKNEEPIEDAKVKEE